MPQMTDVSQGVGRLLARREYMRTTKIMWGLAAFLLTLWASSKGFMLTSSFIGVGLALVPLIFSRKLVGVLAAICVGLVLGSVRGNTVLSQTSIYSHLVGSEVEIAATVATDISYNKFGQREFDVENIRYKNFSLPGRIQVSGFGLQSVQRGDQVLVQGTLSDSFGSRVGYIRFAEVQIIERSNSWVARVRSLFFAGTYTSLPEPQASLGLGFLVGGRTLLPQDLLNALSITGLTHIVAVSGYNLTILVRLTRRTIARVSKYQAMVGSIALISFFLAITGLSPSIYRASVVTLLALTAWYYGRAIHPMLLLLFSGTVTAGFRPHYIWSDLGWWLSFLAFFGVLIVGPLITKRLFKEKKPGTITQIVIETTSAQILTMPLIGAIFGEFSLIAILANAIILPLIPLAMLCTFIAGLAGSFIPALAGWFAWPARILLELITSLVSVLARIPNALLAVELGTIEMLAIYAVISIVTLILYMRLKQTGVKLNGAEVIE